MNHLDYYRDASVRKCIARYCGAPDGKLENVTAEYLVGYGESLLWDGLNDPFCSTNIDGFHWILNKGLDIFRSNWDKKNLLGILDVEYVNFDYPGEPYYRANDTYAKLEPLYNIILEIFSEYGITPFVLVTGQGYHFVTQIDFESQAHKELEKIGIVSDSLKGKYRSFSIRRRKVSVKYGKAFDAMGRIMEFLTHKAINRAKGRTSLPIHITDVLTGAHKNNGREIISIDLSQYGDPVYMRDIRCAFSTHQKHRVQKYKVGEGISLGTPIQVCIPRGNLQLDDVLKIRRDYGKAKELASGSTAVIPNYNEKFLNIISDYKNSDLFKIHQYIENENPHKPEEWGTTYDLLDFSALPPCVSHALINPNDHLLKPTNVQNLTRTLMALGWHPAHIAGLIRSKYERDYDWGRGWFKYDALTRAKFYVRIFASLVLNSIDKLTDYNCISQKEKGFCYKPFCGFNLRDYAGKLRSGKDIV